MNGNYPFYPQFQQGYQQNWQQGYSQPVPDQLMQYRQMSQPMQNQPQNTPQQPVESPFNWVQGEAGAKAYLVAPNSTVVLWDSEAEVIYVKTANPNGMPSMRVFDYTERLSQQPTPSGHGKNTDYVTRQEFEALAAKIAALSKEEEDGE